MNASSISRHLSPLRRPAAALAALAALGLAGCGSNPRTATDPAEAPPPTVTETRPVPEPVAVAPSAAPAPAAAPRPAATAMLRDVCLKDQPCPGGFAAQGHLVLPRTDTEADRARALATCRAFMRERDPSSVTERGTRGTVLGTYWAATEAAGWRADAGPEACEAMLKSADAARFRPLAQQAAAARARGPLLIGTLQPFDPARKGGAGRMVVVDLSRVKDADLDRAMGVWLDRIAQDARHWQGGFALAPLQAEFRNLMDAYGSQVLRVVGPMPRGPAARPAGK